MLHSPYRLLSNESLFLLLSKKKDEGNSFKIVEQCAIFLLLSKKNDEGNSFKIVEQCAIFPHLNEILSGLRRLSIRL
jgi:hypothetical protein